MNQVPGALESRAVTEPAGERFEPHEQTTCPSDYRLRRRAGRIVACRVCVYSPCPATCFTAVTSLKTPHRGVFSSFTQRATLVGLITRGHDPQFRFAAKKNGIPTGMPFFLVAEAGFEPHDLRVMSPTSYQAAPLRDRNLSFKGLYRIPRERVFVKHYFQICSVT